MIKVIERAALAVMIAGLCGCDPSTTSQKSTQSFSSLVAARFSVVAMIYIPAADMPDQTHAVLVTLQKDKVVASCVFSISIWENMGTDTTLDNPKNCDVRSF